MAGESAVVETKVEEISEEEAIRQMEEGFLAGPAGKEDLHIADPTSESGEGEPKPEEKPEAEVKDEGAQVAEETKDESTPEVKEEKTPDALSEEKFLELLKKSSTVEELRDAINKSRDYTNGKVGEVTRLFKAIQDGLSAPGENDTEIDEAFKDLKEQYQDAAPLIIKGMKQVLKKTKPISINAGPAVDPEAIRNQLLPEVERLVEHRIVTRTLDKEHKGWREIVGEPDSKTEFRTWLQAKPEEESKAILNSWDPDVLSQALTDFKESKKPQKPKTPTPTTQTSRLEEAVTPKSQLKPPGPKQKSAEEEMEEGFREGPAGRK